ncbi:zinc-binding dehydrogenase, partial [Streptomyces sp. NPDC005859]|uniref:zinc-binding dehydrogenase n=1 Tax=Streptomyces sp. NPDC005859 TaxID=3157170 RepID=UPI0033FFAFA7
RVECAHRVRGARRVRAGAVTGDDRVVLEGEPAKTLTSLAEQVASGALRVPVTATFPLEQATEAFVAFGASTPGKIAVSCS